MESTSQDHLNLYSDKESMPSSRWFSTLLTNARLTFNTSSYVLIAINILIFVYTFRKPRIVYVPQSVKPPDTLSEMEEISDRESVSSPPPADISVSRTPYNEDTIVKIINEIYNVYLQLNYAPQRGIVFPPQGGHDINEHLCRELGLDPAVILLMKRIPYPVASGYAWEIPFAPYSRAFVYLEDDEIRAGRDPEQADMLEELRLDYLLPHEIALTCSIDESTTWVLDTKESVFQKHQSFIVK